MTKVERRGLQGKLVRDVIWPKNKSDTENMYSVFWIILARIVQA